MSECISFEFKKKSSCIYLLGIWLFWGVLHWYIEECFIIFCFVICGVCLHVFWGGSKKVSIDTAGSVLSREKGPQATGAAGPDGKYRQRVNTKDSIAWAHPYKYKNGKGGISCISRHPYPYSTNIWCHRIVNPKILSFTVQWSQMVHYQSTNVQNTKVASDIHQQRALVGHFLSHSDFHNLAFLSRYPMKMCSLSRRNSRFP